MLNRNNNNTTKMKFPIALCLSMFAIAVVVSNPQHNRGCMYLLGHCSYECPEGTHTYATNCIGPSYTERTCASPVAKELPPICDLSRCECDEPTVKDGATGKCVKLEDCPKDAEKPTNDFDNL